MKNSGQALLLVLLSMAVVLVIVLSIMSRSVTDVAVTSREEEALRAFSAAEAGVERALVVGGLEGKFGNAEFEAKVTEEAEGVLSFAYPVEVASGDVATIWFVAHDEDGYLFCDSSKPCYRGNWMRVCWGKESTAPAVEVSVVYTESPGDYRSAQVVRAAFDPNSGRRRSNSFAAPSGRGCVINNESYDYQATIDFRLLGINNSMLSSENVLQMARIKMLYNDEAQPLGVAVDDSRGRALPSQGIRIESTGVAGESTRKVEVFRAYPDVPPIFDAAIFSPASTGITK